MVDTPIVSESLQKTFRDNFPGQVSSGRDLHVSDVIIPTVDFSTDLATSGLTSNLQTALDTTTNTVVNSQSGNQTIFSTTGFVRVFGNFTYSGSLSLGSDANIHILDGATEYKVAEYKLNTASSSVNSLWYPIDFIVFLKSGTTLRSYTDTSTNAVVVTSCRQIADISGTLVNPSGYTGS